MNKTSRNYLLGGRKVKQAMLLIAALLVLTPNAGMAAALSPRSIQVGLSGASVLTSYTINATTATTSAIASIGFKFCTAPTGACVVPPGLDTTGASLASQGGAIGFTLDNTLNGAPLLQRIGAIINTGTALSYQLSNITNPAAINTTYYVRITTYTGNDGATGPVDTGTVALSTAQDVQLTGVTPEILVFCVGTTITGDCTTASGSSINFGDFSPVSTSSATSVMQAQTNAANGYVVTVTGTTLSSGTNTIAAMASTAASATGSGQFGLNLRLNTAPSIGSDPYGVGLGGPTANYNGQNLYRFVSGEVVAAAAAPTDANTYTASYVVNIGGSQAAGVYTTTLTYTCTATF